MALILLILALLWFSILGIRTGPTSSAQSCSQSAGSNVERCGPKTIDRVYSLPSEGVVIRSVVNNGPLSPEYQAGYEIKIDANGMVMTTELQGEAEPTVRTEPIAEKEIQQILSSLDQCQFYYLPQRSEFDDSALSVGGPVSLLEVHLSDGDWEVAGDTLSGQELKQFESCQSQLADGFGLESPN